MVAELEWMDEERRQWEADGLIRRLEPRAAAATPWLERGGRRLVSFASNDYLGLAHDERVVEAAVDAVRRYGWGAGAAPLVTGWTEEHEALAGELARFEGVEAVAIFASGFAANLGAVAALVSTGDLVVLDRLAHGSLVAGARLSGAEVRVFGHNDVDRLDRILSRAARRVRRLLVVTESLFSMDGDQAPLAELVSVCGRHHAMLLVDEAHATGVIGSEGRGLVSELGLGAGVTLRVGTLSKALGSIGGFVAGSRRVVERVWQCAGSFRYSTSLPTAAVAAARASLAIVEAEPARRHRLHGLSERLAEGLRGLGWVDRRNGGTSPIVPVVIGGSREAVAVSERLRAEGVFVPAIRPPTVARGSARLRISISANHQPEQVDRLLSVLSATWRQIEEATRDGEPAD
ncbi:MAG: 8-amino-7-oxononanoate synthase [Isosphaeraceae bacterium]|jgi:8-amino-7-oxononanoate synthase|nr:MAG: 8-amino-7-oxononanoate synthase [Isosphaeraceae bacterium]